MVFCPFEDVHLGTRCVQIPNSFLCVGCEKAVNHGVNSSVQGSSAVNSLNYSLFQCNFSKAA